MTNDAMDYIRAERDSAKSRGFTIDHDKQHGKDELLHAAEAHLSVAFGDPLEEAIGLWPWSTTGFHVNGPNSSLAKAAALLAAEIDRRLATGEAVPSDFGGVGL